MSLSYQQKISINHWKNVNLDDVKIVKLKIKVGKMSLSFVKKTSSNLGKIRLWI